jgi:ankyrin repeat protein
MIFKPVQPVQQADIPVEAQDGKFVHVDYETILDAVHSGDLVAVMEILTKQPEQVNYSTPENGWMPLHVAVMAGNLRMTDLLLRYGADPSAPNKADRAALHDAAAKGNVEICELLLRYGANPKALYKGETPAQRARKAGFEALAAMLQKAEAQS